MVWRVEVGAGEDLTVDGVIEGRTLGRSDVSMIQNWYYESSRTNYLENILILNLKRDAEYFKMVSLPFWITSKEATGTKDMLLNLT